MAEYKYDYEVVNGPGMLDLAHALFRGSSLDFTVRKRFGDRSQECWVVSLESVSVGNDDLREAEVFRMVGIVHSSDPDFVNQSCINTEYQSVSYVFKHYNARTRKCEDGISTVIID